MRFYTEQMEPASKQVVQEDAVTDNDFSLDESNVEYSEPEGGYGVLNETAVLEAMIVDMYERMPDETRKELMNDSEFQNLVEAGVVGRKSYVRLNRADDLDRRMAMLSLSAAKEANSPDYQMYKKFRKKEKEALGKIRKRFDNRVRRQAITSQKRLVKLNPKAFNLHTPIR